MGVTHARDAFSRHVRGREDEDDRRLGRSVGRTHCSMPVLARAVRDVDDAS